MRRARRSASLERDEAALRANSHPDTADELIALIQSTFELLPNHSMLEKEFFYIERYNHGGMSGGYVSPEFWRNNVIPLFREQFEVLKTNQPKN